MGHTTIGILIEKMILETEIDGEKGYLIWPKGSVIEISSEDDYSHLTTTKDIEEAVRWMGEEDCAVTIDGVDYAIPEAVYNYISGFKNKKIT